MNPNFQKMMQQATMLTRGGNLRAATASLLAALGGSTAGKSVAAEFPLAQDVIDVEARVVPAATPGPDHRTPESQPDPSARQAQSGQFIAGSHSEGASTLQYKLYIPPSSEGMAPSPTLPLVVMLHGCTQNPDDFAAGTGMNEIARRQGFYVLYPAQPRHANSSGCWNWFKHNHQQRGRGEPALIAGMTRDVMRRYSVDPSRVYVAGLSAGGAMAAILGDAYPELFAAVGVHSGLRTGAANNVQTALSVMKTGATGPARANAGPPTIVFHGDKDSTVHPVNGEQVTAASAGTHKPEVSRTRSTQGREYTRRNYRDAAGRIAAEHWVVHGAGHAWSGGSDKGTYTDSQGPDASAEMLRFFLEHPLSATVAPKRPS